MKNIGVLEWSLYQFESHSIVASLLNEHNRMPGAVQYLLKLRLEAVHVDLSVTSVADKGLVRVVVIPAQGAPLRPRNPFQ